MALLRETRAARGLLPAASVARGGPPTPGPAVRPSAPVVPVHALYRPGSGRIRLVIGTVATGQVLIELLPETARALAVGIMDAVDQSRGHRGAETLPEPEPTEEPPWSDS